MRVVLTLSALAALLATACTTPDPAPVGVPVTLTLESEFSRRRLTISGTTDLADGAVLVYEARHENWVTAGEPVWLRSGQIVVAEGAYAERLNLRRWPAGAIEVWVAFQSVLPEGNQPGHVLERFGAMGERLIGSNVTQEGPMRRVELSMTVEPERR